MKSSRTHLLDMAGIAFVAAVLGIAFWANQHRQPERTADEGANTSTSSGSDDFCTRAGLVSLAVRDCKAMMAQASTDEERLKIEKLFTMGPVKAARPPRP